jgi:hypothetical protein
MTQKYQFEELDLETREYLMLARDKQGKGMPGIYAGRKFYLPLVGLLLGFGVMIATLIATFPPTLPPAQEAMLQTAGFLLGGWMVVAALRVWTAGKSGKYAGHFVYADPENLYEGKGSVVHVTDLNDLRDAKAVQNFNEGKYKNTSITIKIGKDRRTFEVDDEERGRRLTVYLNAVCYMRDGGEDGRDTELQKLSPEAMGAVAKQVARTGEFPRNLGAAEEEEVSRVPKPRKEGRRSTGILAMLVTVVVGVLMFFGFRTINAPLRDQAVFDQIKSLPAKDQPYALRVYLMNPDFRAHRDEAQQMLNGFYDNAVRTHVNGTDDDLKKGMSEVVLALKTKPQPVVSFIGAEEQAPAGQELATGQREGRVQRDLADKWGSTIGDELVVFAAPADPDNPNAVDKKSKGMIDLRWKFMANGGIEYTIQFRKSPDEEPVVAKELFILAAPPGNPPETAQQRADKAISALIDHVLNKTVGGTRPRLVQQPMDF